MEILIRDLEIKLSHDDILRGQGVEPHRATKRMVSDAKEILISYADILKPAAIYNYFNIKLERDNAIIVNDVALEGPLLKCFTGKAKIVFIAFCTIGADLENEVKVLMADKPAKALALEGLAISAVGNVAKFVEELINNDAATLGYPPGIRVQPGQEGWPLEEQKKLINLVRVNKIGITLSSSCLMTPHKSLSFMIATGPGFEKNPIPCSDCPKNDSCNWKLLMDN